MRCAATQLSTSTTTNFIAKSPYKRFNSPAEYEFCTPVRTVKRSRPADEVTNYVDHVESEFYRVFSDRTPVKRFKGDNGLSFLFRGPTNDIITSTVGMYGEIAHSSLKAVCKKMVEFGLDEKSVLLDLGSGRGVPNFVFASDANIFSSIGIEKCPLAYMNSVNNICAFIARDIKGIRTEIQETPSRSLSDLSECSTSSDGEGSKKVYKTPSTSTDYAPSSPGKTSDYSDVSISTQLEEDEYSRGAFNDNAETPKRFLRAPKLPHEVDLEELKQGLEQFKNKQPSLPIAFVNEDIIAYDSFEGVTHFYSFDIAMERALINNMVYQFMNTSTAYVFGSFISDLMVSFGLKDCFLGAKVPCRMYGSNEGKTCYIYVKNNWKKIKAKADAKIKRALGPSKKVRKPRKKATTKKDAAAASLKQLTFDVNNFRQPYRALDIIKLSKLPLYHQYSWYLSKLDRFYSRSVTRSYSDNLKESLASERDALIEQIAHKGFENSQAERAELKAHIATHYRKVSRFPEPL